MTITTGSSFLDALNGTSASAKAATAATTKSNDTIDQAGFLKLLTTQLQTQDPTAPTDNSQMIAQMASFSQLSGITEMNASLKDMASNVAAARFGDASGWIGRSALVASSAAAPLSNGYYAGQVTLPADASGVSVALVDGNGQTVRQIDLGAKPAGAADWAWDGKDANGNAVTGKLTAHVTATGTDGSLLQPTLASWADVQSVQSPTTGSTKLVTALGTFAPSDVAELS